MVQDHRIYSQGKEICSRRPEVRHAEFGWGRLLAKRFCNQGGCSHNYQVLRLSMKARDNKIRQGGRMECKERQRQIQRDIHRKRQRHRETERVKERPRVRAFVHKFVAEEENQKKYTLKNDSSSESNLVKVTLIYLHSSWWDSIF